mmetsp:Transcript_47622/g.110424  ORF Transcript_47622/g.110424 Transcript_47622/m.110424 type:complete len:205 (-) Transcript_47622:890-1504(-)
MPEMRTRTNSGTADNNAAASSPIASAGVRAAESSTSVMTGTRSCAAVMRASDSSACAGGELPVATMPMIRPLSVSSSCALLLVPIAESKSITTCPLSAGVARTDTSARLTPNAAAKTVCRSDPSSSSTRNCATSLVEAGGGGCSAGEETRSLGRDVLPHPGIEAASLKEQPSGQYSCTVSATREELATTVRHALPADARRACSE